MMIFCLCLVHQKLPKISISHLALFPMEPWMAHCCPMMARSQQVGMFFCSPPSAYLVFSGIIIWVLSSKPSLSLVSEFLVDVHTSKYGIVGWKTFSTHPHLNAIARQYQLFNVPCFAKQLLVRQDAYHCWWNHVKPIFLVNPPIHLLKLATLSWSNHLHCCWLNPNHCLKTFPFSWWKHKRLLWNFNKPHPWLICSEHSHTFAHLFWFFKAWLNTHPFNPLNNTQQPSKRVKQPSKPSKKPFNPLEHNFLQTLYH